MDEYEIGGEHVLTMKIIIINSTNTRNMVQHGGRVMARNETPRHIEQKLPFFI